MITFFPVLENNALPIQVSQLQKLQDKGFVDLVRKIRQKYQLCLAAILRSRQKEAQLQIVSKVFGRLQNLCWDSPICSLWEASLAFSEGLRDGNIELDKHATKILREMDSELKYLIDEGTDRLNNTPKHELIREILYRIAKTDSSNSLIIAIKRRYSLDKVLKHDFLDTDLIKLSTQASVVKSIQGELGHIKEALNLYKLDPYANEVLFRSQLITFQQLSDTFFLLGMNKIRDIVDGEYPHLQSILRDKMSPWKVNDILNSASARLIDIESALQQFVGYNHMLTNQHTVISKQNDHEQTGINKVLISIEQVKHEILNYLASQDTKLFLDQLLPKFKSVQDNLSMISLSSLVSVVGKFKSFIQEYWIVKNQTPSLVELDILTDMLSGMEDYLGQSGSRGCADLDNILDVIQAQLDQLLSAQLVQAEDEDKQQDSAPVSMISAIETEVESHKVENVKINSHLLENTPVQRIERTSNKQHLSLNDSSLHTIGEDQSKYSVVSKEQYDQQPDQSVQLEESECDRQESYAERMSEFQKTLNSQLQAWHENINNTVNADKLKSTFHIIKSNSRSIGAEVIGELAWSFENMINKVVEESVLPSESMILLLDDFISILPELVNDFVSGCQQLTPEVLLFMEKADAFCQENDFDNEEVEESNEQEGARLFGQIVDDEHSATESNKELESTSESETDIPLQLEERPSDLQSSYDQELLEIFSNEAGSHLSTLKLFIEKARQPEGKLQITDDIQRALHTLKGSALVAGIAPIGEFVAGIEKLVIALRTHQVVVNHQVIDMLETGTGMIEDALLQLQIAPEYLTINAEEFFWLA